MYIHYHMSYVYNLHTYIHIYICTHMQIHNIHDLHSVLQHHHGISSSLEIIIQIEECGHPIVSHILPWHIYLMKPTTVHFYSTKVKNEK